MKKRIIAMAVAGAVFGAGSAFAAAPNVSGFADVILTITDEAADTTVGNPNEGQFTVPSVGLNFATDGLRIDLRSSDLGAATVGQAFFTHEIMDGWKLSGGYFNSHITADEGDAPDMQFTNNSILFSALAGADGHKLAGVNVSGMVGPANLVVAYTNDPSNSTLGAGEDRKNSISFLASGSPMEGLNLELGFLGQDAGIGDIMDINGTYAINNFTVGLDYMSAGDATSAQFDNGYSLWAGYNFGNGFNVKARYEVASPADSAFDDTTVTELFGSYALSDTLSVNLDIQSTDDGTDTFDKNVIEFVGIF